MINRIKTTRFPSFCTMLALFAFPVLAEEPAIIDSDFEKKSGVEWPEGWQKISETSWEEEDGNGFLRIQAKETDKMTMVYREIGIPDGTEAFTLSWKQRVSDFQRGSQSWFDIRIMMEFLDGDRKKVTPNPPTPTTSKNTKGWEEKSVTFEVPNTATLLKFMPTLFRVESGTWDLDDVVLRPVPKPKS